MGHPPGPYSKNMIYMMLSIIIISAVLNLVIFFVERYIIRKYDNPSDKVLKTINILKIIVVSINVFSTLVLVFMVRQHIPFLIKK